MKSNQQREADETLVKINLEPATEQEADEVAGRIMKRLCHADNDTLRSVCTSLAGRMVEMTCRLCDEYTFSTACFGLLEGFLDEAKQDAIENGILFDGEGNA